MMNLIRPDNIITGITNIDSWRLAVQIIGKNIVVSRSLIINIYTCWVICMYNIMGNIVGGWPIIYINSIVYRMDLISYYSVIVSKRDINPVPHPDICTKNNIC